MEIENCNLHCTQTTNIDPVYFKESSFALNIFNFNVRMSLMRNCMICSSLTSYFDLNMNANRRWIGNKWSILFVSEDSVQWLTTHTQSIRLRIWKNVMLRRPEKGFQPIQLSQRLRSLSLHYQAYKASHLLDIPILNIIFSISIIWR